MKLKLLLLSSLFVLASCYAKANGNPGDGEPCKNEKKKNDLNGGVYTETKKPLSNVNVTAYYTSKKEKVVITDGNGNYAFDDLRPGAYKFVFEKEGYKKVTREKVIVKVDEGFQMNIEMVEQKDFDFVPSPINIF